MPVTGTQTGENLGDSQSVHGPGACAERSVGPDGPIGHGVMRQLCARHQDDRAGVAFEALQQLTEQYALADPALAGQDQSDPGSGTVFLLQVPCSQRGVEKVMTGDRRELVRLERGTVGGQNARQSRTGDITAGLVDRRRPPGKVAQDGDGGGGCVGGSA